MVNLLLLVDGIERLAGRIREADAHARQAAEATCAHFDATFCEVARSSSIQDGSGQTIYGGDLHLGCATRMALAEDEEYQAMVAARRKADQNLAELRDELEAERWKLMAAIAIQVPLSLMPLENELASTLTGVGH